MSGLGRLLPSTVTGPRELKLAMFPVLELMAPTLKASSNMAGGSLTVPQAEPALPAEATVTIPAERWAAIAVRMVTQLPELQPSAIGQPQELFVTSGAMAGLPWAGVWPIG